MLGRRRFLGAAAIGLVGGALPFAARAQGFDTARIIVGFPPGGTTDIMARKVADRLRGPYARSVIVENRPGAGGQLGVVALKDAPADGSVMLLTPSSMLSIYPYTYRKLQYTLEDVARDGEGAPALLREGLSILLRVLYPVIPHTAWTLWRDAGYAARHGWDGKACRTCSRCGCCSR